MIVEFIGFCISIFCIIFGLMAFGISLFQYLTVWTLTLHTVTLCLLLVNRSPKEFTRKLLIISWCLGCCVSSVFWFYYFVVGYELETPLALDILIHGGILSVIVRFILKNQINVVESDVLWSLGFFFVWLFGCAIPLRFNGIIVYPLFLQDTTATFLFLNGFIISILLGFFAAYFTLPNKIKDS